MLRIIQTLATAGFVQESEWNCEALVWRGKNFTWVATSTDGCSLPSDEDWLICEYAGDGWDDREEDIRSFASDTHYLADVIAAMLEA